MKIADGERFFPGISQFLQTIPPKTGKSSSKARIYIKELESKAIQLRSQRKEEYAKIVTEDYDQDFEESLERIKEEVHSYELDASTNFQSLYESCVLLN